MLQANIGGLLTFTAALRALPAVTAVAASLCGNMLVSVCKPSSRPLFSDLFVSPATTASRDRPLDFCNGFMSEETIICMLGTDQMWRGHAQAVLGSLLLDEAITGRWLVGACCLLAGQALIALATKSNGVQTATSKAAKTN